MLWFRDVCSWLQGGGGSHIGPGPSGHWPHESQLGKDSNDCLSRIADNTARAQQSKVSFLNWRIRRKERSAAHSLISLPGRELGCIVRAQKIDVYFDHHGGDRRHIDSRVSAAVALYRGSRQGQEEACTLLGPLPSNPRRSATISKPSARKLHKKEKKSLFFPSRENYNPEQLAIDRVNVTSRAWPSNKDYWGSAHSTTRFR